MGQHRGHDDELSLTLFNELGNVVKTVLEVDWLWGSEALGSSLLGLSLSNESLLLGGGGLW